MTIFLHTFLIVLLAGVVALTAIGLWMGGVMGGTCWLFDRNHPNLAVGYMVGYVLLTMATVAGVVAAVG